MRSRISIVITWGETDVDYWVAVLDRGAGSDRSQSESAFGIGKTTKKGTQRLWTGYRAAGHRDVGRRVYVAAGARRSVRAVRGTVGDDDAACAHHVEDDDDFVEELRETILRRIARLTCDSRMSLGSRDRGLCDASKTVISSTW